MPEPPLRCAIKNVPKHCQMYPGEQNCSLLSPLEKKVWEVTTAKSKARGQPHAGNSFATHRISSPQQSGEEGSLTLDEQMKERKQSQVTIGCGTGAT